MTSLSHSQRLRQKLRLVEPRLDAVTLAFWNDPKLSEMFPDYLFTVHSTIRASVPLMQAAERQARSRAHADPVAERLAKYMEHHIEEELDHDRWLLEDMQAIGIGRDEVLARPPSPAVASLVGSQYYWIFHAHPVALLGYIAVLEGNPPTAEGLAEVEARTGLPHAAFRTLLKHGDLDPHHCQELNDELDRLPLTEEHAALLGLSAFHTVEQVSCTFEEILDAHRSESSRLTGAGG